MNALVIGSGGREHAIVKSLTESKLVTKVFTSPGNAGTAQISENIVLDLAHHQSVVQFCQIQSIQFVFIGPEAYLVDGLADSLRAANILVVGPSKAASQLEGSKIFAKEFMKKAGVPTAHSIVVESVSSALQAAKKMTAPYILKADGLASGKGVFICKSEEALEAAAKKLFVEKIFGAAGQRALLEQNLPGSELSFMVLTNGSEYQMLPIAQDHKRLLNKNLGPNTGGMGTVAPVQIPGALHLKIIQQIIEPTIAEIKKENLLFYGVLFVGIMVVGDEPFALEYNVRFGDPETQVIIPLIKNDLGKIFYELAKGNLEKLEFSKNSAVCIVNAAAAYPEPSLKEVPIQIPDYLLDGAYVLHAATKKNADGRIYSSGGRVLNVIAVATDFKIAKGKALELNSKIIFSGRQFRTDIGDYQLQRKAT